MRIDLFTKEHVGMLVQTVSIPAMTRAWKDMMDDTPDEIEVKADLSLVLPLDKAVELEAREAVHSLLGLPFYGEEFGADGVDPNSRYVIVMDPIDGSRPRANRDLAGFTNIVYVYDRQESRIVATIISRPGTGEIWTAHDGRVRQYLYNHDTGMLAATRTCRVWNYDDKVTRPTVYVDNPNPFSRRDQQMLMGPNLDALDAGFRQLGVTKFSIGSNGLHHCLVANGGAVVGAITTSVCGIQDLGGLYTIECAGGKVAAFTMTSTRGLLEVDPHTDLFMNKGRGYDFAVGAISRRWLDALCGQLHRSLSIGG